MLALHWLPPAAVTGGLASTWTCTDEMPAELPAVPETLVIPATVAPACGEVIATVGGALLTVTETEEVAVRPTESVAIA